MSKRKVRIIGYCRVSTAEQASGNSSLDFQISKIREYAIENYKKRPDLYYRDAGYSGKDIEGRPGLTKLLSNIKPGDIYIFTSVSRLGRNTRYNAEILDKISSKGAQLKIIEMGNLDFTSITGKVMFGALSLVGQAEREMITERSQAVVKQLREEGKLRFKPRYGYRLVRNETNSKENYIEEHPEEQKTIAIIRQLVEENPKISLRKIANVLTEQGITIRKSKKVHPETIRRILFAEGLWTKKEKEKKEEEQEESEEEIDNDNDEPLIID